LSSLAFGTYSIYKFSSEIKDIASPVSPAKPSSDGNEKAQVNPQKEPAKISRDKMFNILLLGIDRRSKQDPSLRTDVMILASINQNKKKIVLTSVPRDLWLNSARLNALYTAGGFEGIRDAFEAITGMRADAFIRSDFEDLVWLVDSMGGLEIELNNGFTDNEYPNDAAKIYMTVSFQAGKQTIDGSQALVLARSRHGNNGEGSDFRRMQRQHKILKAMPSAVLSPKSIFNPFNLTKFFEMLTSRMATNLNLADAEVLWSFYNERDSYSVDSFFVDSTYLFNPPMAEYGGAWVLRPINNDFTPIHLALKEKLGLIMPD
ncbi:LCP family protein, partial [candidate division WWE3 bacterium]|nr:LCP family protein [candidate division WWE3 bacterium]